MPAALSEVTVKQALTPTGGFLYSYTHTLTPYWGCTYACFYCYVGESPIQRWRSEGLPWGTWIKPKVNIAEVLEEEVRAFAKKGTPLRIFFSSSTEPFLPRLETCYGLSRACLEVFMRFPPELLIIQTRSPLVERYFDLIARIPTAVLNMTIETDNDRVRRLLTPSCPTVERRFHIVQAAVQRGIPTQITVSPVLPHHPERFADLLAASSCQRVIVDSLIDGDGAQGTRSQKRGAPELLARYGWADWFGRERALSLYRALVQRMGEDRVGYSKIGFNQSA